jgi:P pilus assembly chaperone PapD
MKHPSNVKSWKRGVGRIGLIITGCALALGSGATGARANIKFGAMPMESQIKVLRPGGRATNDIEIYNGGDVALQITARVSDWTLTQNGDIQFLEAGSLPRSCASWIQMNPTQFSIAPKKAVRVRYTLNTPLDLAQEHWAMIFFKSRPIPVKGENNIEVMVAGQVGVKIFVAPAAKDKKDLPRKGHIKSIEMLPAPASKLQVTFENTGATHLRLSGTVEARNAAGEVVGQGILQPKRAQILSGSTRNVWVEFEKPLPAGTYTFKVVADYGAAQLAGGSIVAQYEPPVIQPAAAAPAVVAPTLDVAGGEAGELPKGGN